MKLIKLAVVGLITVGMLGAAIPAQATEEYTPVPDAVGARFVARAHIAGHSYTKPWHEAHGKVGLVNKAERGKKVSCMIAVQYQDRDGEARAIAWGDAFDVYIGANTKRDVEWSSMFKDKKRRYNNVPVRANAHCRVTEEDAD